MRIHFVALNLERLPDPVLPVGLLYLMANTPSRYETSLVELLFADDPLAHLTAALLRDSPDVVALGLRNLQSNDYTGADANLHFYRQAVATVRRFAPDAHVVLGGSGFSVAPEALMRDLQPDFGIAGEGEAAFPRLLKRIEGGTLRPEHLADIPNLHFYHGAALRMTRTGGDFVDLDALKLPDPGLADVRHLREHGTYSIQSKRGCSLECTYCTYPQIEGRQVRVRAPAAVADEMARALEVADPPPEHFFFVDSVFNRPRPHAAAICRELIARGMRTPWTAYVTPLGFDDRLAALMAEAGCAGVELGTDSGCDDILASLKKGFTIEQVRRTSRYCREAGIKDCHTFVLGTEGETLDDVSRTLDFICELAPFAAILMAWTDDAEALTPTLARRRRKFRQDVLDLIDRRRADYPRWVVPTLGINYDTRVFAILRKHGIKGPLWQCLEMLG